MNNSKFIPAVLSIAGSDSSGGAGIQADIKTITAHKLFAMTAITALTAQNTTGVSEIHNIPPKFVAEQLNMVFTDIPPAAVKIGMVSEAPIISTISERLSAFEAPHIVIDPVMVSTSGSVLLASDATSALIEQLFPLAEVITPNIPEAEILADQKIENKADMLKAAEIIAKRCSPKTTVLLKGGHLSDSADDLIYFNNSPIWLNSEKVITANTHGTGCTLSSAIACNLAINLPVPEAIKAAKEYVSGALAAGLELGHGNGPLNHMFQM